MAVKDCHMLHQLEEFSPLECQEKSILAYIDDGKDDLSI